MPEHILVGFGFGPIQAGLFAKEAFQSGNFQRIVIAEIDQRLVKAVQANGGTYCVNVAGSQGIEAAQVSNVELLNLTHPQQAVALRDALAEATEVTTCLPSVAFYDSGGADSVASLIADGLAHHKADATIFYAAENNNRAAEILEQAVTSSGNAPLPLRVQFLNTVIGKMSQMVTEPAEIARRGLAPIAPGIDRAFLVEEFNRILVSRTAISEFAPGIEVFIEKDDLLPFEEAKLYGHNAIHALLGFIGTLKGYVKMTELSGDGPLMRVAHNAFIEESGAALIRKHGSLGDELFTEAGYRRYAEDLLERMTNPYLADTVARASRDVVRKLGVNDRIFGTMTLALEHGIEPVNMAMGAMAGIALLLSEADAYRLPGELHVLDWRVLDPDGLTPLLTWLWQSPASGVVRRLIDCTYAVREGLANLLR